MSQDTLKTFKLSCSRHKVEKDSTEQLIKELNTNVFSIHPELKKNDEKTVKQAKTAWDKYQSRCRAELMKRIKEMLLKFITLGYEDSKPLLKFCELGWKPINSKDAVDAFCSDYKSDIKKANEYEYWNTWETAVFTTEKYGKRGSFKFNNLHVFMEDWARGECISTEYVIPIRFLEKEFDPKEDKDIKIFMNGEKTKITYHSIIPGYATVSQMERFNSYMEENPLVKSKLKEIFNERF